MLGLLIGFSHGILIGRLNTSSVELHLFINVFFFFLSVNNYKIEIFIFYVRNKPTICGPQWRHIIDAGAE